MSDSSLKPQVSSLKAFSFGFYTAALAGALLTIIGRVDWHDVFVSLSLAGLGLVFAGMMCAPLVADNAPAGSGVAKNPKSSPDQP
ncbi:MAG: hypothetical protein IT445_00100 [Phycisphaeraceae bacterium]|nr:hypothetical protein [Phycisphaeraceae bacterium]